jgi:hypothetical protein
MLSGEKSHVVKARSRRIRNHHHLPGKVHGQSKLTPHIGALDDTCGGC